MHIIEMRETDRDRWDEYVRHSQRAVPQHLSGWQAVMQRTYGYRTRCLMAVDGNRVEGVLPLFEVRSWLLGRSLNSMPGGVCAECGHVGEMLLAHAKEIARETDSRCVILHDSRRQWLDGFDTTSNHATWILSMCDGAEATWRNVPRNVRRFVRIARENGLIAEVATGVDRLETFYRTFSSFVRQLGTPIFSRAFLRNIADAFPGQYSTVCIRKGDQVVGAFFQLLLGDTIYNTWGASLPEYREIGPTYLAHWELMRFGIENGYCFLDMGRSPLDSGGFEFKKRWGGQMQMIYQQSYALNGRRAVMVDPARQVTTDAKLKMLTRVWSRLPLPVAEALGPQVRRHIPFA